MTTTTATKKREAIIARLRQNLESIPDDRIDAVDDPAAVSDRMAELVPTAPSPFAELIGPVYSTRALTSMWDVTRAAVSKKAREGHLLTLKVEGENLFPLFQFAGTRVRDDVIALVKILRASADPFTTAQWLCTPLIDDERRRTPLALLDDGEQVPAQKAAMHAATRWAA